MRTELLGVLGAALLAPAAAADEPGLELSRDGRTWSPALSGPLLDEDARIVPGGSTRADLWVRNSSAETTTMSVITRGARSTVPSDAAAHDDFRVRVAGTRVPPEQDEGCRVLTTEPLDPGERQRVPVSVHLPSASGNVSQEESVTMSMRVHLVAGRAGDPCDPGDGGRDEDPDSGDDEGAAPPETPGRVSTDGGPGERGAWPDLLGLGLVVAAVAAWLRRRGRARSAPPAS